MVLFIFRLSIVLFILSFTGYILVVLKEKFFLKNNLIVIDNKYIKLEDIEETDVYEFIFRDQRLKSGDEIKITTKNKGKVYGTIIGAREAEDTIHIITYDNEVIKCDIDNILKFKVVSKYGRFFID